jgi:purine-binding chemotaxis protein CheW
MSLMHQLCTFSLGGLLFGVEVGKVQEVIRYQEMTSVPLAPPEVEGLINLRGQIVTAIDLRRRLGMSPRTDEARPLNVVVQGPDGITSLLVDEIGDVLNVEERSFEPPPGTLRAPARELIRGAYKLELNLILALDVDAVVACGTD